MWIKQTNVDKFAILSNFKFRSTYYQFIDLMEVLECIPTHIYGKLKSLGYFWVDDDIVDLVAYLNIKGFKTLASCSGHPHKFGRPYIMFDGIVDISKIEFVCQIKSLLHGRKFEVLDLDGKTAIYLQGKDYYSRVRLLNIINRWCSKRIIIEEEGYNLNNGVIFKEPSGGRLTPSS